jgi:uncharacterized membrane protein YfcA
VLVVGGLLSILVGLSLGLLGGGGSILMVPLLVNVIGLSPKEAITTSLAVVALTSAAGLVRHAHEHHVRWRSGLIFGAAGMAGATAGGLLSGRLSDQVLMILFAGMMLATAVAMLRSRRPRTEEAVPARPLGAVLRDGAGIGVVTGLVGAGGGFLVVPALHVLGRLSMRDAIGTSLLVIALQASAGLAAHAAGATFDPTVTAVVSGGAVLGSVLGGVLSERIHPERLRRGFAVLVLVLGAVQLGQWLLPGHP